MLFDSKKCEYQVIRESLLRSFLCTSCQSQLYSGCYKCVCYISCIPGKFLSESFIQAMFFCAPLSAGYLSLPSQILLHGQSEVSSINLPEKTPQVPNWEDLVYRKSLKTERNIIAMFQRGIQRLKVVILEHTQYYTYSLSS